jgi:hypothetical protein
MAKKSPRKQEKKSAWSERIKLTPEESLKRVHEFPNRMEVFIAAARKGKNRSVSA